MDSLCGKSFAEQEAVLSLILHLLVVPLTCTVGLGLGT